MAAWKAITLSGARISLDCTLFKPCRGYTPSLLAKACAGESQALIRRFPGPFAHPLAGGTATLSRSSPVAPLRFKQWISCCRDRAISYEPLRALSPLGRQNKSPSKNRDGMGDPTASPSPPAEPAWRMAGKRRLEKKRRADGNPPFSASIGLSPPRWTGMGRGGKAHSVRTHQHYGESLFQLSRLGHRELEG